MLRECSCCFANWGIGSDGLCRKCRRFAEEWRKAEEACDKLWEWLTTPTATKRRQQMRIVKFVKGE